MKHLIKQMEQDFQRLINKRMELKLTDKPQEKPPEAPTAVVPNEYLMMVELLPDGRVTNKPDVWLAEWADFTRTQVTKGVIKLHEVPEYNPDTGQVPNSFIHSVYLKNRKLN